MNATVTAFIPATITPFITLEEFPVGSFDYSQSPGNEETNIINGVYALLKIADFLSKGLLEKVSKSSFGFNQRNSELLAAHCLNDAYRYNFPFIMGREDRHTMVYKDEQRLNAINMITSLAEHMSKKVDMKRIVKSKSRFVQPKNMSINDAYFATFSHDYTWDLRNVLEKFEGTRIENTNVFDVQQVIMTLLSHMTLVDTLVNPHKISFIKDFVSEKMENNLNYFISGYPNDIFVIDRRSMEDKNLSAIFVAEDRCISYAAFNGDDCKNENCTLKIYEKNRYQKYA